MLGVWEILAILFVIVLLFGANRLPALSRSLGQSIKEFKKELKSQNSEDKKEEADKKS